MVRAGGENGVKKRLSKKLHFSHKVSKTQDIKHIKSTFCDLVSLWQITISRLSRQSPFLCTKKGVRQGNPNSNLDKTACINKIEHVDNTNLVFIFFNQ